MDWNLSQDEIFDISSDALSYHPTFAFAMASASASINHRAQCSMMAVGINDHLPLPARIHHRQPIS
jgi:hypothetical protein